MVIKMTMNIDRGGQIGRQTEDDGEGEDDDTRYIEDDDEEEEDDDKMQDIHQI